MGRTGGVEQSACRVLPIIDEGSESDTVLETTATMKGATMGAIADRRKAVVARMRELLRRAVTQSSSLAAAPQSTVAATARKWKRAVSFRSRDHQRGQRAEGDSMSSAASSVSSSRNSFGSRDATFFPSPSRTSHSPATTMAGRIMMQQQHHAQWITTDSDFVVLEL
ncbi:uncharacterized protein LOC124689414 [Lolium rigidum]|uniref:uncharacterized protein LOC124689414 n=1 Tax=Lolium rigidum TaxID=89674 RepID=UPI001F5C0B07|nr:uncharacterized protein LOC124689414 [Lolium rigidum]